MNAKVPRRLTVVKGCLKMKEFTKLEMTALIDAAQRPGGWGLYNPKTTAKLAKRGFFVLETHTELGMRYRLTQLGRAKAWWGLTK
jgi:hypothetical protein